MNYTNYKYCQRKKSIKKYIYIIKITKANMLVIENKIIKTYFIMSVNICFKNIITFYCKFTV